MNREPNSESESSTPATSAQEQPTGTRNSARWLQLPLYCLKLVIQPLIAVAAIVGLVFAFSFTQQMGYFTTADGDGSESETEDDGAIYYCSMFCVAVEAPGRCPVCGMELQAMKSSGDPKDFYGVTLTPADRRVANIQTVTAARMPLARQLNAFGKIQLNETSEATIPAFVDGRIEKLFVDFEGAEVKKGQELALLYSPELYSAQVEFLQAKQAMEEESSSLQRVLDSNQRLYKSARQRLIEFGLPEEQVAAIEKSGTAQRRLRIVSPISGTVTSKLAVEWDYVKTGVPLFKIADLSNVWLQIELFPDDAAMIQYGQKVDVSLQSQAGTQFEGRVAFVAPRVNEKTQTVSVRVVVPNDSGMIRIGDLAQARISLHVIGDNRSTRLYDADLAGKWISPKHPYIVRDQPGKCPECGEDLVPASEFGFASQQLEGIGLVVVPRQAVLMSGKASVAYVETNPGRFEFRKLVLGPIVGDRVAIVKGIEDGEQVVSRAAFMLDAAFNMARKPSLIDPNRVQKKDQTNGNSNPELMEEIDEALTKLSDEDEQLARHQRNCPIAEVALGSMGVPVKVNVEGRDVFICCEGCRGKLLSDPQKYFARLDAAEANRISPEMAKDIKEAMSQLSESDRKIAQEQVYCPVMDYPLGGMGVPKKVDVNGQPVFICCDGCRKKLLGDPDTFLKKIQAYKKNGGKLPPTQGDSNSNSGQPEDLPQMELPQMDLPKMDLPGQDSKKEIEKSNQKKSVPPGKAIPSRDGGNQ